MTRLNWRRALSKCRKRIINPRYFGQKCYNGTRKKFYFEAEVAEKYSWYLVKSVYILIEENTDD
jgi:hypothetical protein